SGRGFRSRLEPDAVRKPLWLRKALRVPVALWVWAWLHGRVRAWLRVRAWHRDHATFHERAWFSNWSRPQLGNVPLTVAILDWRRGTTGEETQPLTLSHSVLPSCHTRPNL